jgi:hypothetical protein
MEGEKRDLRFEYGLGGSIDMRVSRELGALVPAYSVQSALYPQRQSLYPFGDASNLPGRALREEVLRSEDDEQYRSGYGSRRVSALEARLLYQRKFIWTSNKLSTK